MNNAVKVSLKSLEKAIYYKIRKNYGRSFAHYLVFLELCPHERNQNEYDFLDVLFKWVNILEKRKQIENLFKCYLQALNYYPSNIEIIHNLGAHLLRIGEVEHAEKYLKLATILDSNFLPAEKNLYTLKLNLLPRWHFRMLNDCTRNLAFKKAILNSISSKYSTILDIGTGTGILSLFASSHKDVSKVVAVEESRTLCKVTEKTIKANQAQKILVLNKHSTDLVETDLSNILVMEIFDAGVFGEHVLETLIHAWEHLLEKDAVVIPQSVVMCITGIECLELYKKHKVSNSFLDFKLGDLCVTRLFAEPYDAENLQKFDFKCVTNTHEIFVDFSKLDELRNICTNTGGFQSFKLTVSPEASVHAFAIWFDLNLNDKIQITTNPFKENCKCWEQAIIYLDHPCNELNSIDATISCLEGILQIKMQDLQHCAQCFKVSGEMVTFLNDLKLFDTIKSMTEYFPENYCILDLNPFPIFGLVMAQKSSQITCLIKDENDEKFLRYICEKNNVSNVIFITEEQLDIMLQNTCLFDIVFINAITCDGLLNEKHLNNLMMFQNLLKPNGIILPETVQVVLKLIESPMLESLCKVEDENCLGLKIAEFINEYSVPELWSVNPRKLSYKPLTGSSVSSNLLRVNNIECNQKCKLEILSNGQGNGILYWYKIGFNKDKIYDTFASMHYNCACFLLEKRNIVTSGEICELKVKIHNGLMKIYQ